MFFCGNNLNRHFIKRFHCNYAFTVMGTVELQGVPEENVTLGRNIENPPNLCFSSNIIHLIATGKLQFSHFHD